MDNAKSIIDIEVNDDQFKEFQALYQKYRESLGTLPNAWRKVEEAAKGTADETERQAENVDKVADAEKGATAQSNERLDVMHDMTAALMAHMSLMEKSALRREADATKERRANEARKAIEKEIEATEARQNKLLAERQSRIRAMSEGLTGVIGKTASIGLNIAKWGAGVGLAMIGGGFFGMDRLGTAATADRSTARGLGVSAGELRAWRTDFAPYGNPDALLSASSNAYSDPMMRATLERAGVRADTIRSGNTSQIAEQTLRGLTAFYKQNQGPNAQQIWQSRGFGDVIGYNEMRQFANVPEAEQRRFYENLRRDRGGLNNSDRTLSAWQDFRQQLTRAGEQIKTTFLDGLVPLTGPMSQLSAAIQNVVREFMSSGAFRDIIKVISQGLNDLAGSLKDGSAQRGIKNFTDWMSDLAKNGTLLDDLKAIEAGLHTLAGAFGWVAPGDNTTDAGRAQKARHDMQGDAVLGGAMGLAVGGPIGGLVGAAAGATYGGLKNSHMTQYHASSAKDQDPLIALAKSVGADDDRAHFLSAISSSENQANTKLFSPKGAMGLMQLMPATALQYGVHNPFNKRESMQGAAAYVNDLVKHYHGDMTKVAAAYNSGQGTTDWTIREYGEKNWLSHMPDETQTYVNRVAENMRASQGVNIRIQNTTGGAATVTARQAGL